MKPKFLMTPGPTPVPSFVRASLSQEIIHHRTSEFQEILGQVNQGLKTIFCTANPVLIFSSSGTGTMEAAVSNLFSRGDKVITISGGKFGQRWTEIAQAYDLEVVEMSLEWGKAPSAQELKKLIEQNTGVKGVLTTLCETSTATVYDIEALAKVTKDTGVLSIVDAISGLGQDKLLTDQWGLDAVVCGSQKGFMLPPGLGFLSLSQKAQVAIENSDLPKYYFDLKKALKGQAKNDTPFTPSVSLIVGLKEAVKAINSEGIEARWDKFAKMAEATRQAALALGLKLFSQKPSASVTAIYAPANIKSGDIVRTLRTEHGLSIAGGQAQVKDKIFRIAHMGGISQENLIDCFLLLEKVLQEKGYSFESGASVRRLKEVFYG